MKFLITGGSGFVGNSFSIELLKKYRGKDNSFIFIVRNRKLVFLDQFSDLDIKVVKADISNKNEIKNYFKNVDYVFHLAAKVDYGAIDVKSYYAVNEGGTKNILDLCYSNNVKKVIYLGTAAIYHPMGDEYIREHVKQKNQITHYTKSKYNAHIVVNNFRKKGLQITAILPSSVFGYKAPLFDTFIRDAIKFRIIFLPKKGGKLSFIMLSVLVKSLITAIDDNSSNLDYFVSEKDLSLKEFIEKIEDNLKIKIFKFFIPNSILKIFFFGYDFVFKILKIENFYNYELFKFLSNNFLVENTMNKLVKNYDCDEFDKEFDRVITKYKIV